MRNAYAALDFESFDFRPHQLRKVSKKLKMTLIIIQGVGFNLHDVYALLGWAKYNETDQSPQCKNLDSRLKKYLTQTKGCFGLLLLLGLIFDKFWNPTVCPIYDVRTVWLITTKVRGYFVQHGLNRSFWTWTIFLEPVHLNKKIFFTKKVGTTLVLEPWSKCWKKAKISGTALHNEKTRFFNQNF